MRDETRHARVAFALATAYGGSPVGPSALEVAGALGETDLVSLARLAIREGCVGETAASRLVEEGALRATDPALAASLREIAVEELSHAELAWLTLRFALDEGGAAVAAVIEEELELLRRELRQPRPGPVEPAPDLAAHGVLGDAAFLALRREAIEAVVVPVLGELLRARRREAA
jgi:hypothetical protein